MRFKVGDPIDSRVGKKIQSLQDTFGATNGSKRSNYIELQSAVPWIRMQSGVRLDYDANIDYLNKPEAAPDALAKKYVLFGSNTRIETKTKNSEGKEVTTVSYNQNTSDINLSGYKNTDNLGIRPRPGIIGMQIKSHNRFGSLRTATVRFQCWSKEDMDALEVLYMRPGYSVLLEWGHSKNLTVDGSKVEPSDLGLDFYDIGDNSDAVYQEIVKKRLSNHYGYDAILGTIKNFSWKFRPDGGYDCSVDLISPGELIESYKANFFLPQKQIQEDGAKDWKTYIERGGSTQGLFPNVVTEDHTVDFALGQIPSLYAAYVNFVAQAESGLNDLKAASALFAQDKNNIDSVFSSMPNFNTKAKTQEEAKKNPLGFLALVNELVQKLAIAKDGMVVDKFLHEVKTRVEGRIYKKYWGYRRRSGFFGYFQPPADSMVYETPYSTYIADSGNDDAFSIQVGSNSYDGFQYYYRDYIDLRIKSNWRQGIVDLNVGNNITSTGLDTDLPDGGFIAVIPQGASETFSNLSNEYTKTSGVLWSFLVQGYLLAVIAKDTNIGNIWECPQVGDSNPDDFAPTTAIYPAYDGSYYYQSTMNQARDANGNEIGLNLPYIDASGNIGTMFYSAQINNSNNRLLPTIPMGDDVKQLNVLDSDIKAKWASDRGLSPNYDNPNNYQRYDIYDPNDSYNYTTNGVAASTATKSVHVHDVSVKRYQATERRPFYFLPLKYKGFNPNNNTGETSATISSANELQEVVPRDQYLSKLHYYLRQYVELPYAEQYFGTPSPDDFFTDRFEYRPGLNRDLLQELLSNTPRNYSIPGSISRSTTLFLGGIFTNTNNLTFRDTVYIPFKLLLELINKHVLRSYSDYFFTFVTDYDSTPPQYYTFIDHISMDPRYCILPHTLKSSNFGLSNYTGDGSPTILNIELSINFILDTLAKYLGNDGRVALLEFLQDLLDNISRVCGGVNDLQLQFVEDSHTVTTNENGEEEIKVFRSKFHIVDRKVISPIARKTFEAQNAQLNLYGLNSVIQDVDLVSKLTPKITSMVAISAQANPYTTGEEATGFNAINKGLVDRIFTRRYEIEGERYKKDVQDSGTIEELGKKIQNDIIGVLQHLGYFYEYGSVPPNADEQVSVYENYAKFMIGASSNFDTEKRLTYNFVLPYQLNLTLHGISGIKVMDAFVTSQDILPKTYGGRLGAPVGYLVTGVEHVIDREGWKTMLKTQIYNIDEDNPKTIPGKDSLFLDAIKENARGVINYTVGMGNGNREVDLSGGSFEPLIKLIGRLESADDYGLANTTSDSDYWAISTTRVDSKTIAQLLDNYGKKQKGDPARVFAMGRFQITTGILEGNSGGILAYQRVIDAGISRASIFNATTQDILLEAILLEKQSGLREYLKGEGDGSKSKLQSAIQGLAREFAPFPCIEDSNGRIKGDLDSSPDSNYGYYGPADDKDKTVNPAKTKITITDVAKILIKCRLNRHNSATCNYNPYGITADT